MNNNNLDKLVKLLESLKKAYVEEVKKGNQNKAEEIKAQILKLIVEIKKIKEEAQMPGETQNIENFRTEIEEDSLSTKEELEAKYYDDDYDIDEYKDQSDSKSQEDLSQKSIKKLQKEIEKEKRMLEKIAKNKKIEEEKKLKLIEKKEKYALSNIKKLEKEEKRKIKRTEREERQRRKASQIKEIKWGTVFLFVLFIILLVLISSRSYIYWTAYKKMGMNTIRYIDMYNFLARLYILVVTVYAFSFTIYQRNLKNINVIRVLILIIGVLLFISFDGLIVAHPNILRGDKYLIFPGILLIVLIDLVGKNMYRDKIHYDFDYR